MVFECRLCLGIYILMGEDEPGSFMRSDVTQIQRHINRIFLEIHRHQLAVQYIVPPIDMFPGLP
jgi:hypothetical protein